MKIVLLSDDFPPNSFGGAGTVAYDLAMGLQKKGHDIFLITTVRKKSEEGEIKLNGLNIFKIYNNYNERWRAWLSLYNPRIIVRVKKIIKEIKPDIVHAHNIHYYLSYGCLKAAKKYAKAVFLTAHDVMLVHYGKLMPKRGDYIYKISTMDRIKEAQKRYNPFRGMIIRYYLRFVDKIFPVSYNLKKLLKINGINNTEIIYNGIDVKEWKTELQSIVKLKNKYNLENKNVLFFGGRLGEAKGGYQIIKVLPIIKDNFPNTVLIMAGEINQYAQWMKKNLKELNLEDSIIFTGFLNKQELISVYHNANICIFPSLCFETFGMFNLEAMACKKPVISSYFGGPREVVLNEETGYLINPNNTKLIAEKIIDLLKNPQKARRFGEAGYQRVKEFFSLDEQVNKTLEWYKKYV